MYMSSVWEPTEIINTRNMCLKRHEIKCEMADNFFHLCVAEKGWQIEQKRSYIAGTNFGVKL